MELFHKWKKKNESSVENSNGVNTAENMSLSQAEQVEKLVNSIKENEMQTQISSFVSIREKKETYIFEYPTTVSNYVGIAVGVIFSLIFLYFLIISFITMIFSKDYIYYGIIGAVISIVVLTTNIFLICKLYLACKFNQRYDVYYELLGFKSWEYIEDFALCSGQTEKCVIMDLVRAVKMKLIPQGHFSRDNTVFMTSDNTYEEYKKKLAVYDRYFKKVLEKRRRVENRSEFVTDLMDRGEQYIKKFNDSTMLIKDKKAIKKIVRLKNVISMIFHEIDVNPSQTQSLGVFLNYYLPTTEKLLDAYVEIDGKVDSEKLANSKKEIEEVFDTIIEAFENILEDLYEKYETEITSEIEALEIIMKTEENSE